MAIQGDNFELKHYLTRIGLDIDHLEPLRSTSLLQQIVWAHITHIPFENLSIIYPSTMRVVDVHGTDASRQQRERIRVSLEPDDLYHKMVLNGRGGFCFEQNLLLGRALRELGFEALQIGAKGINRTVPPPPGSGYPLGCTTHLALLVTVSDGSRFLVDAGIGWSGMPRAPLPLLHDQETRDPATGECYRLLQCGLQERGAPSQEFWGCHRFHPDHSSSSTSTMTSLPQWLLQYKNQPGAEWWDIMHFREENRLSLIDCEMGAWFASTHPSHPQTQIKLVALMTQDGRYSIIDNNFTIRRAGVTTAKTLQSDQETQATLQEYFNLNLKL